MNPYFMQSIPVLSFFGFFALCHYRGWTWQRWIGGIFASMSLGMVSFHPPLPPSMSGTGYIGLFIVGFMFGVLLSAMTTGHAREST